MFFNILKCFKLKKIIKFLFKGFWLENVTFDLLCAGKSKFQPFM